MKNKSLFLVAFFTFSLFSLSAQSVKKSALEIKNMALQKETVQDSVDFLKSNIDSSLSSSDRRSLLALLGNLQEDLGLYTDASKSYAKAAGIAATDAEGFKKVSAEEHVLNAVRTALLSGDYETAGSYLNSAVRSSKDQTVIAYVNLYEIWAKLCRAASFEETSDSVELLKAYASMESMKEVRSKVLFTLWYVTEEKSWGDALLEKFPESAEALIYTGKVQIASVPFWYFVPRKSSRITLNAESAQMVKTASDSTISQEAKAVESAKSNQHEKAAQAKNEVQPQNTAQPRNAKTSDMYERKKSEGYKQQLGLYKSKENAVALVKNVRTRGFDAYYYSEVRASGTTYYIVVVDDADKSLGKKITASGFDCYPVK